MKESKDMKSELQKDKIVIAGLIVAIVLSVILLPRSIYAQDRQLELKGKVNIVLIKSPYLKVMTLVYEDFKTMQGIPSSKKRLENYQMEIKEDDNLIHVELFPKPSDKNIVGGGNEYGEDIIYIIRKKDFKILKRFFTM
jgi:hypothetical protein